MKLQLLQQSSDAKAEHTGVPVIVTGSEIALSCNKVGLFDKAMNLEPTTQRGIPFCLDVAKASFWIFRPYSESDQPALCCKYLGLLDCLGESRLLGNQMICRKHQHLGIRTVYAVELQGSGSHCRRRIATKRFKNEA
ncbi:hypothetical protein SAMN04244572_00736 [Azotobacter beijerinckii]|uniref:Uncharacterized protein n=1 Tax=Azotobacter beijerinckii TaxID=170623 RepID=A0A1H6RMQ8_9GAMM|nr:hypothetical protein SAMN04244572_00736 [Azotobacter beijerinckii]